MHTQHYDVIISGAGPTGLLLANQLNRFGVNFLLLDKKGGPTIESRALAVQARSMEIYEQMGLSDEVEKEGWPAGGISLYKNGKKAASVFLKTMGTGISPFPYVMIYEQSKNESLLYQHLSASGQTVGWNTELTNIVEKDNLYFIDAVQDGTIPARYSCQYLVACDGGKSAVRDFSGMPFRGGTYENVFFVADTYIKRSSLAPDMLSLFLTRQAVTLLFPMKGKEKVRVLGTLPKEYYHRDDVTFDEIADQVKKNMQVPLEFYNTQWYSTYKLHYKKVDHFNKGNIFFAGDAAHVHSPAGGQGMNTGLQDAYNLGWKLSLVLRRQAGAALLNSYHEERNPVAERLLKTTDRLFTVMTNSNYFFGFIKLFVVPRVLPLFNKFSRLRARWFGEVSQIKINYRDSSLSKGAAGQLQAGDRFPWFYLLQQGVSVSVYHLIRERQAKPFLLIVYNLPEQEYLDMDKALYQLLVPEVNAANNAALKQAGFPSSFIVLLRPDNYIGYISATVNKNELNDLMKGSYHLT